MPDASSNPFGPGVTLPAKTDSNTGEFALTIPDDARGELIEYLPQSTAQQLTTAQQARLNDYSKKNKYGFTTTASPMVCQDDHCHPEGTMVMTSEGEKAIETLAPDDLLVGWSQNTQAIRGGFKCGNIKGYAQTLHSRMFSGHILELIAGPRAHGVTPEHYSIVRWNKRSHEAFAVYLMQKGNFWRVGKTKLFSDKGTFGPGKRANAEKADRVWILGLYDTNVEAMLAEERFSIDGQIPKALFIATTEKHKVKSSGLYAWVTQQQLDAHHVEMQQPEEHYVEFLESVGLKASLPIWEKGRGFFPDIEVSTTLGRGRVIHLNAVNIVSGFMEVPCYPEELQRDEQRKYPTVWEEVFVTNYPYVGNVYSLKVEGHSTYFANKIATHNCPFHAKCPLVQNSIPRPFGQECPVERAQIDSWQDTFSQAAAIDMKDPGAAYDALLVDQIVFQMVLESRAAWQLAIDPRIEKRLVTGYNPLGQPFFSTETSKAAEFYEKLTKTKIRLLKELLATRKSKADAEAKGYTDPSRAAMNLMQRANKLRSVVQRPDGTTEAMEITSDAPGPEQQVMDRPPPIAPTVPGEENA